MASSLINDGQCVMTIRALGTVVPDSLEAYMRDRISRLSRLGWSFTHVAVEIEHERNPRMADSANRVQVTCRNPHLVVRAEFADVTAAATFDACLERLHTRLRKLADKDRARRRGRYGRGHGTSPFGESTALDHIRLISDSAPSAQTMTALEPTTVDADLATAALVVREKQHEWRPMSVAEAIDAMELLGHSFYLFINEATSKPAVVYQRKAFTYGVVKLGEPIRESKRNRDKSIGKIEIEQVAA